MNAFSFFMLLKHNDWLSKGAMPKEAMKKERADDIKVTYKVPQVEFFCKVTLYTTVHALRYASWFRLFLYNTLKTYFDKFDSVILDR